ncbi:MAG TPA: hypothetical protein VHZ25_01340 [Acidobacteriaceae bacterium]|jgi:hypothetical protein|nr:hypothetical protein [Acidobacteriaceae bacterium]
MECRQFFTNGTRCRCRATAGHVFCRHHAPQPRPFTRRPRNKRFGHWRDVERNLATLDFPEMPATILLVLDSLFEIGPLGISDRKAGYLLRALLRRLGSIPFRLPDDPEPQPDPAFALSQSIDRMAEIIRTSPTVGTAGSDAS